MLVQVPLEMIVDVAFECGRAGIREHSDRDLAATLPGCRYKEIT